MRGSVGDVGRVVGRPVMPRPAAYDRAGWAPRDLGGHTAPMTGTGDAAARARQAMVERQLRSRGVTDERVLDAMCRVPRERFVHGGRHRGRLCRRGPAHRLGPDHLPAVHRRPHDGAPPRHEGRPRPRGRHGLGLPDGDPRRARLPRDDDRAPRAIGRRGPHHAGARGLRRPGRRSDAAMAASANRMARRGTASSSRPAAR